MPAYQGPARVTLLVIDPYLVHAYWDVDPASIARASQAILRVYDTTGESGSYFDVSVSLPARSWYIQLWTPERSYYAELGIAEEGGAFRVLARSNTVQTPRAWPAVAVEHWVEPADPEPKAADLAPAAAPVESPKPAPSMPPPPPLAAAPQADQLGSAWRGLTDEPANPLLLAIPEPVDAAKLLRARLEQIYATIEWMARPAEAAPSPAPAAPAYQPADLTQLAEEHFSTGISSKPPKAPA